MTSSVPAFRGMSAADDLVEVTLPDGWLVTEKVLKQPGDTGGNFSINYWVENADGRKGFCKVLNFDWLLRVGPANLDPLQAIATATAIYQFERDMARRCIALSRVITAIGDGAFNLDGYAQPLVSYIIFESADKDIRRLLNGAEAFDTVLRLRALHHLATGIRQLHGIGVAHQDIKPSNTLVFKPDAAGARQTKLGDLGRASARDEQNIYDAIAIAGDPNYAPPEGLYKSVSEDFAQRRLGCDLYQLGSMICFAFSAATFNALLLDQLFPVHTWANWTGTYEEVVPYVRDAYERALETLALSVPTAIRDRTVSLVGSLCEPDVRARGHTVSRRLPGNPYSLDRIVTELDLLTRRAEVQIAADQ